MEVEVSSNAPYSGHLEYGTSRMAARPFMGPAARKERANVVRLVTEAAKRAVNVTVTGG
jgi:HK97 gp10 family phage protein